MSTTEIKIGGLGGQGVIMTGMIIGRGASIYDTKHATLTQAFGPEARGSACSAQVILSDRPIEYPYVHRPDLLVVMSQEAYTRFVPEMSPVGTLIYESELVHPRVLSAEITQYGIPATRFAEELGRRLVSNIVMVGFIAAVVDLVEPDAMRKSVEASVPKGTESLNLGAFDRGFTFGKDLRAGKSPEEVSSTG